MTDESSTPDRQEAEARSAGLWHDEYMDLRDEENLAFMVASYQSLERENEGLDRADPKLQDNIAEMQELYALYLRALDHHFPERDHQTWAGLAAWRIDPPSASTAPTVQVQAATPPDKSPSPENPVDTTRLLPGSYTPASVSQRQAAARQGGTRYTPDQVQNAGSAKRRKK